MTFFSIAIFFSIQVAFIICIHTMDFSLIHGLDSKVILPEGKLQCSQNYFS